MVHTAELTYFPDSNLIEAFNNLPTTQYYRQEKTYWNGSLKESHGLTFRIKKIGHEGFGFVSIRMICRINFKKLISENPKRDAKVDVMTVWDIEDVEKNFNAAVEEFLPQMPKFEEWKVNRIDYCVNVHTDYVEEYLNLLKKGDRPHLKDWYDRQGNYYQKPGSLYLVSTAKKKKNRGITVNFYNKYDEIIKTIGVSDLEAEWDVIDEILELAGDVLRLEIQCHKPKTEHLRKKYGMPNKCVKNYLNPSIAYELISGYVLRIAGSSEYNRKSITLDMVEQSNFRMDTKKKMSHIIIDVAKQHSSIAKVREKYVEEGIMEKAEYNNLIRKMHDKGINPVTIRNNKSLINKKLKEGLPSLISLFKDAFEDEMAMDIKE